MAQMKGKYIGPIAHLKDKTAILQKDGPYAVTAQFDDMTATRSGEPFEREETQLEYVGHDRFPTPVTRTVRVHPSDALGFGWHRFPVTDFEIVQ
jgi:hypothetical protein